MKSVCFLFIFLNASLFAHAQGIELSLQLGVGSFQMGDLKKIQDDVLDQINIAGAKKTSSFPVYGAFSFSSGITTNDYAISAIFGYETTGSRIAYSDYSGSYFFDQLAKQYTFGGNFKIYSNKTLSLYKYSLKSFLFLSSGISFSHISFSDDLTIGENQFIEVLELREISSFLEPGIGISTTHQRIKIEPYISIHIPIYRSGLFLKGEPDAKLEDENGVLHANWFGIRTGLKLALSL